MEMEIIYLGYTMCMAVEIACIVERNYTYIY
jgi:hypothetical protein